MSDAITLQGGLLSGDFLERLRQGDAPGCKARHYDVPGRLEDRITSAWNDLQNAWRLFQLQRGRVAEDDEDDAYRVTRDHWLRYLFDALRYGHLTEQSPLRIEGTTYPIRFSFQDVPIQVVAFSQDLDKGPDGTARGNPHSRLQQYVNHPSTPEWGILTNGLKWRLLRDNAASTRPAFVEFDLEAMMGSGEDGDGQFDVFGLFWRIAHASRITGESPWLEKWMREADRQGIRALEGLRTGVTDAIELLGAGFLKHPKNQELRDKLESGELSAQEYFHQVLRLVYRLLFLFVTEDRGLLMNRDGSREAKETYQAHYGTQRLRRLAREVRGSQHHDLFESLKVVMDALKSTKGCAPLALPPLNSALWSREFIPDLDAAHIRNLHFLQAIRKLSRVKVKKQRRNVDYKNLGSEELGGVYESLLELSASVNPTDRRFTLTVAGGNERKTTGSYYTPDSIIQVILDHSLEPLLEEACEGKDSEAAQAAILDLKVCDPTCGSGHFLIAAAHRIARKLAEKRTGEDEPLAGDVNEALRDVVAHCVYGVDINPMAVELCKVGLWLEAMVPGKPLTFLEHKIQVGNAVIGATPLLLRNRLPDAAFNAVEGDDKDACKEYKARNKKQVLRQVTMHGFQGIVDPEFHENLVHDIQVIEEIKDDTVAGIEQKEKKLQQHLRNQQFAKDYADAWTAAFFQVKQPDDPFVITQETLNQILEDPNLVPKDTWQRIQHLRDDYKFFHWHLAFPEVIDLPATGSPDHFAGGFDLILGNPPWDDVATDEPSFFSRFEPQFKDSAQADQKRMRESILQDEAISRAWHRALRSTKSITNFLLKGGRYAQFHGGKYRRINIFRPVVEHGLSVARPSGRFAQVLPEPFYKSVSCGELRKIAIHSASLEHLIGFVNTGATWFADVHQMTKFCVAILVKGAEGPTFRAAFDLASDEALAQYKETHLEYPLALMMRLSPEDLQVMEMGSQKDIDLAEKMYGRAPVFGKRSSYCSGKPYATDLNISLHRPILRDKGDIPVFEGKMIWHYDYRASNYTGGRAKTSTWDSVPFGDERKGVHPQWFVARADLPAGREPRLKQYRAAFRDVTNPENERCFVSAVIPREVATGHSLPYVSLRANWMLLMWVATVNSISLDWAVRPKVALHMTFPVVDSLPIPNLRGNHPLTREVVRRAAQLTCVGPEVRGLWNELQQQGFVTPEDDCINDPQQRLRLECEIHAIVAKQIYGLTRNEFSYQFDRFGVLQRKDKRNYGHFRTKDWSLEAYDALPGDFPSATTEELWGEPGKQAEEDEGMKGKDDTPTKAPKEKSKRDEPELAEGQSTLAGAKQVRLR